ncbi:hypothetical protein FKM82_023580 [Ascaphus truei]
MVRHTVLCNALGEGTVPAPTCAAVACEILQSPSYGRMNCVHALGDFQYNSSCSFHCEEGFILNGTNTVLCNALGEWTVPAPTCAAVVCEVLQRPSYGRMTCVHALGDFQYNSSCSFHCEEGFILQESETVLCQASGEWSDPTPTCAAVACEVLQSPSYGRMNCVHALGDFQYNSSCSFHCEEGFILNGANTVLCNALGEWTVPVPTCAAVACEVLQRPSYGRMTCVHALGDFQYNSSCSFHCEEGFILQGSETVLCQASGEWSDPTPTCAAVVCEVLQSPSYGRMTCVRALGDFQYNSSCSFHCEEGFILQGSEKVLCQASGEWSDPAPTCAGN